MGYLSKRKDKKKAEKAWVKSKCEEKADQIFMALRLQIHSPDWKDPQFIPYPSKYINDARWEDEITPTTESASDYDKGVI